MKYISLGYRYNLLHLALLVIFTSLRDILQIIINEFYEINSSLIFCILMFSSEFLFGIICFIYSYTHGDKKTEKEKHKLAISLIYEKNTFKSNNNFIIIILILFMGSYFDFESYIIPTYILPKYKANITNSLDYRIRPLFILVSSIINRFTLDKRFYKHQKLSILIIFLDFIIMISYEFIKYYGEEDYLNELFITFLIIVVEYTLLGIHTNEVKYLIDFLYLNPYKVMFLEGLFGLLPSLLTFFVTGNYKELKGTEHDENNNSYVLTILLILYFILCGFKNIFAYMTIKLYSPTTYAMSDLMLVPFLITYYYIIFGDKNGYIFHFILNILLSIINIFFSCVYNELLILNFCDLEYSTYPIISNRATEVVPNKSKMGQSDMESDNTSGTYVSEMLVLN